MPEDSGCQIFYTNQEREMIDLYLFQTRSETYSAASGIWTWFAEFISLRYVRLSMCNTINIINLSLDIFIF